MTTRHLILQSLLFLNHVMKKLHSEHGVMNQLTNLQTLQEIDLKKSKISQILLNFCDSVLFVAMATPLKIL